MMDERVVKALTVEEAISMITGARPRNGSIDEVVVERAAQMMVDNREMCVEAFAMFAMHLDENSPSAPIFNKYAHEHFHLDVDWQALARHTREGNPLKQIAQDADKRELAVRARKGAVLVFGERYQSMRPEVLPKTRMPRRLDQLVQRLDKSSA